MQCHLLQASGAEQCGVWGFFSGLQYFSTRGLQKWVMHPWLWICSTQGNSRTSCTPDKIQRLYPNFSVLQNLYEPTYVVHLLCASVYALKDLTTSEWERWANKEDPVWSIMCIVKRGLWEHWENTNLKPMLGGKLSWVLKNRSLPEGQDETGHSKERESQGQRFERECCFWGRYWKSGYHPHG